MRGDSCLPVIADSDPFWESDSSSESIKTTGAGRAPRWQSNQTHMSVLDTKPNRLSCVWWQKNINSRRNYVKDVLLTFKTLFPDVKKESKILHWMLTHSKIVLQQINKHSLWLCNPYWVKSFHPLIIFNDESFQSFTQSETMKSFDVGNKQRTRFSISLLISFHPNLVKFRGQILWNEDL